MSPDRDPGPFQDDGRDVEEYEEDSPRSIFSALWFRALLAVLVLGVLAAIAVPYVLDFATTPTLKGGAAKSAPPTPPAAVAKAPVTPPAPAPAAVPTAAPAAAPAAPPADPPAPRAKPEPPAPPAAKSTTTKTAPPKPVATKPPAVVAKAVETKPAAKAPEAVKPAASKAVTPAAGGPFWVQVGAFKDAETAKQVAARLRGQGLQVEESTATVTAAASAPAAAASAPAAAKPVTDRYDVVVSGAVAADVDAKLASKGMTGEATPGGIVVRPSLALRDAVALSRDLADSGLSVQVRRVGGPAPSAAPAPPAAAHTLHRVRVGGYPDRAAAVAAMKQLEDKGYKPFITPGGR